MRTIFSEIVIFLFLLLIRENSADSQFVFNKFNADNLTIKGAARVTDNGLLQLTDYKNSNDPGSALYSNPVKLKGNVSFSTTFVIGIVSAAALDETIGQGMAFVIAPKRDLQGALSNHFLGPFNDTNNGNSTSPAYFIDGRFEQLSLDKPIQVWVEYDAIGKKMKVTLAPLDEPKPGTPLLTRSQDLSAVSSKPMHVGFSASAQSVGTSYYVLGWSFEINGTAQDLNLSSLPKLPPSPPPSLSPSPSPSPLPKPPKNKNIAMNARLGDFGLPKLNDHGAASSPGSGAVRGLGYIAPEMQYGMPSTQTDVYAFGAFLLEIASGRTPNLVAERGLHLVDWVSSSMKDDAILNTADKRLGGEYAKEEMLLVLKLGLLCCRFQPTARPTVQKIVKYLSGDAAEADLRALNTVDEAPVRSVGGGSTPPRSGTQDIFL
ncbi:hypothetical protein MKW92_022684 [Papaver armeniacum]|nr:hypothetical protein MKW92_022684 [Papaver armeniacum]